jgi:tetratricopeptide (TPR) repeat protein
VASEYYNRGQALFRQHKPALAQAQFDLAAAAAERGRENVGDYYDIWVQSAQIDMARGRFDSAQQYLDRAMKLRPSNKVQGWMEELGRERAATQAAATQSATQRSSGGLIP